jgi:lipoate-protein ligase A
MLIINRPQTDPYFNIAAEEYLFKNIDQDCFMLWQNEPSIIVGKHQNTLAEINYSFVKKNKIPVIRRISGGGTVFHDQGNLNFTFISSGEKEKLVNFKKFTQPIIKVLNQMNIPARFEGKNDLRVNGLKISGNAEHVYKNKVLHHGTLLFSSDLDYLNLAIKVVPEKFNDKAVKSVRSTVANITDFMESEVSIKTFKEKIIDHIKKNNAATNEYSLTQKDVMGINKLVKEKYKTWQWNFGYSPMYSFETKLKWFNQNYPAHIYVKNGIIENIEIKGSTNANVKLLQQYLIGKKHAYDDMDSLFFKDKKYLEENGLNPKELINFMF